MPKKKQFIDKKHAVTFSVGSRSQRDPLLLAGASEAVLLPACASSQKKSKAERQAEREKYGIYYEDDYDYLQHLKDVDELNDVEIIERCRISASSPSSDSSRLQLPSSVFGSSVETKVGLLNRAVPHTGPQLDWDPDIVAGLDTDFNYTDPANILEDDFISMAEGPVQADEKEFSRELESLFDNEAEAVVCRPSALQSLTEEGESDTDSEGPMDLSSEDDDDDSGDDSDGDWNSVAGQSKSGLTSYSMTSSVMPRNAGLTLLDDMFEKFAEKYCEEEIGDLSHEEIEGYLRADGDRMQMLVKQFEQQQHRITLKDFIKKAADDYLVVSEEGEAGSEEEMTKIVVEQPTEKWDCETILTTHSTLYNHPSTIREGSSKRPAKPIKLTKVTGIPADVLGSKGPTSRQMELEQSKLNRVVAPERQKGESLEEKRARKQAVKEIRRTRREQKTAMRKAFQEEKLKQDKEFLDTQHNLQSVKIV